MNTSHAMTTYTQKLLPGTPAPAFDAPGADGQHWTLAQGNSTLLIFYRGSFCSYCRKNLQDFDRLAGQFALRGIDLVFASADDDAKARFAVEQWELKNLRVCHGLRREQMQAWGVYQSAGNPASGQAAVFSEPALFLIKQDLTLSYAVLNSAPFGRPSAADMLAMIDFIAEKGPAFPQRGGWH